jgi:hypothetical protein
MLIVNGYKMVLGSAVGTRLQPWLLNTQFSPMPQLLTHMGIVGELRLSLHLIQNLKQAGISAGKFHDQFIIMLISLSMLNNFYS